MLIPEKLRAEMFYFIDEEFSDLTIQNDNITEHKNGIMAEFNKDKFNPRDGTIVRLSDHLAAYIEADMALCNGATSSDFINAKERIRETYSQKQIAGLDLKSLFLDFK